MLWVFNTKTQLLYEALRGVILMTGPNLDSAEIDRFNALASVWWDRKGPFKALHDINPVRSSYVAARSELNGKQLIDVGCGGGLLAEALATRGARVTAIDMAAEALASARSHAAQGGHTIDYQASTAEQMARRHPEAYDIVTCMELLEHVPDPGLLVSACGRLLRPGGDLFFATVNRTVAARILVIWAAEYLLGIVRRGTHDPRKFVRPAELAAWASQAGLVMAELRGLRYFPLIGKAALCRNTALNYMMHFKKPV
jgi:2-polyprenyl-6-hydroxyphenyl methylase / 3-demethylubiquinone-9 3-methyltransferase